MIVLTDRNVARCRPELFEGCDPICMEPGEEHKTLQTVEEVCRELIRRGADRTTFLLGVGGGIVTDVTGFVASVYMRGVPFGFVSTTLLGCVDASVGGKNGVNLDGYKNMAGVFAQPQFVVCDTSLFATLPLREIRAGLAEAVKAGIIGDEPLFGLIERAGLDGLCADPEAMDKVVVHSVRLKAAVVSRDEREHGERRKLNLGHTFGHAVEKCSREMIHGEAVAVGMAIAARLAVKLGLLAPAACDRIVRLLAALGFATEPPVPAERLLAAVTKDKKSEGDTIRLVLPDRSRRLRGADDDLRRIVAARPVGLIPRRLDETISSSFAFRRCGGDAVVRYAARVGTRSVPGRARCRRRGGHRRRARGQGDRLGRRRPSDAGDEHLQISAGAGRSGAVGLAGAAAFGAVGSDGRRSVARYVVAVARGASGGRTFLARGAAALHGGRKRQLRLRPSDPRDRRHRGCCSVTWRGCPPKDSISG